MLSRPDLVNGDADPVGRGRYLTATFLVGIRTASSALLGRRCARRVSLGHRVLVDARMRKHAAADGQIGYADLTVGLGPALVAGRHAHVVVETSWDGLATVITEGASLPLAREPREIAENARDRYVYATVDGVFRTKARIGDSVRQDHGVAEVGAVVLTAPLDRVLRGLIHDDVPVTVGTKVIEVDPRGSEAEVRGLGERARRVAEAVLQAVSGWAPQLSSWVRALHLILRGEQEP